MPPPTLTADKYERAVASLRGARLASVAYYPLTVVEDGREFDDRDRGWRHRPVLGVELPAEDSRRYSAAWEVQFRPQSSGVGRETCVRASGTRRTGRRARTDADEQSLFLGGFLGTLLTDADIAWARRPCRPVADGLQAPRITGHGLARVRSVRAMAGTRPLRARHRRGDSRLRPNHRCPGLVSVDGCERLWIPLDRLVASGSGRAEPRGHSPTAPKCQCRLMLMLRPARTPARRRARPASSAVGEVARRRHVPVPRPAPGRRTPDRARR